VPENLSVVGEFAAVLTNETLPAEAPAVSGAKVTVKETFFPAGTLTGKLIPLTE